MRKSRCAEAVTLTGTAIADVAKTVTVEVAGGTATVADDFAAVADFTIAIPAGMGSASGTFDLTPVADSADEGDETVAVGGTAAQGETDLPVDGTTVTIANVVRHDLTVTAPANGRITGSGIDCGGTRTDCAATFADNVSVTLEASPEAGYALDEWTDDCSGRGDCGLVMDADRTVGATFGTARKLTVTAPANGKITGGIGTEEVIDCGSDCAETVADGTAVALKAEPASDYGFSSWGGACAAETSSACSVTLNADRTVSVAFVANPVDGRCDESTVDGCADGTLNTTAHSDTDADHHWRCDGQHGGANSGKCTKAKAGCTGGSRSWSVGDNSCAGSVTAASSGQTRPATDSGDPTGGSASFECDDGAWTEQSGSTCTVDLACGATENSCSPAGVDLTDTADAAATNGQCASTESVGCLNGTTFRDRSDDSLEHGVCGSRTNQCAGGRYVGRADTTRKNQWRCQGVDAKNRWSCSGIDGSKNWSCGYGGQSLSCSVPVSAPNAVCSETTAEATGEHCFTCKPCPGANETPDDDCDCVCKAGHHRDNGVCVRNPRCSSPLVENACRPSQASVVQGDKTVVVHGKCSSSSANSCAAGNLDTSPDDSSKVDGQCGTATDECSAGTLSQVDDTSRKNLWKCLGMDGSTNWACEGTDGHSEWSCEHGTQSVQCDIRVPGKDKSCSMAVVAKDDDCSTCKACSGANEEPDDDCDCVCKSGYERDNGVCKQFFTVTVKVTHENTQTGGRVTGSGFNCTGTCSRDFEGVTRISLSGSSNSGYKCKFTGNSDKTSYGFDLTADKTVNVKCDSTLDVDPGGPYTAGWTDLSGIGGGSFYTVLVTASASGGVPGYKYTWEGHSQKALSNAVYAFVTPTTYYKSVIAQDSHNVTESGTARIDAGTSGAGGASGADGEAVPFEVPLGGELIVIWAEDSTVSAHSADTEIVGVTVSSPSIRVVGVSVGETDVVVEHDGGTFRIPVTVK